MEFMEALKYLHDCLSKLDQAFNRIDYTLEKGWEACRIVKNHIEKVESLDLDQKCTKEWATEYVFSNYDASHNLGIGGIPRIIINNNLCLYLKDRVEFSDGSMNIILVFKKIHDLTRKEFILLLKTAISIRGVHNVST